MKENVKVVDFVKNGRIALLTVSFDIVKNGEVKTKKNNIATRCIDSSKFQQRLIDRNHCDGVVIVGIYKDSRGELRIPLIKEYRPVSGYIWSFPAGQVDPNEDLVTTTIRELKEETGLDANIDSVVVQRPTFTSVGLTDQRTAIAFAECYGEISDKYTSASEDIKAKLMSLDDIQNLLDSEEEIGCNTRLVLGQILLANGNLDLIKKVL